MPLRRAISSFWILILAFASSWLPGSLFFALLLHFLDTQKPIRWKNGRLSLEEDPPSLKYSLIFFQLSNLKNCWRLLYTCVALFSTLEEIF
jgi:hypothetical protein